MINKLIVIKLWNKAKKMFKQTTNIILKEIYRFNKFIRSKVLHCIASKPYLEFQIRYSHGSDKISNYFKNKM